jgi:hypothetical protein
MKILSAVLLASSAVVLQARAGGPSTFRCGNDLLKIGESKAAATQKCGAPVARDSFCKPQPVRTQDSPSRTIIANAPCETVDEWTYNPGYGQFMTTLRFESGKLVAISYGERVK